MGGETILKSDERSTGPSRGTSSNTLPERGKLFPVKWLVRVCHCSELPRMDHVAAMAAFDRVTLSAVCAASTRLDGATSAGARTVSKKMLRTKRIFGILEFPSARDPSLRLKNGYGQDD